MRSSGSDVPSACRERWLAEVAEALGTASALLRALDVPKCDRALVAELFESVELALVEARLLRLSRAVQPARAWDRLPAPAAADRLRHPEAGGVLNFAPR